MSNENERVQEAWKKHNTEDVFSPVRSYDTASSRFLRGTIEAIYIQIFEEITNPGARTAFLEIGGNYDLAMPGAVKAYRGIFPALRCNLIAHDFAYNRQSLIEILLHGNLRFLPETPIKIQKENPDSNNYEAEVGQVSCRVSSMPISGIDIPGYIDEVHVFLFHVINYIDRDELIELLSDPKIKTITLSNTADRGYDGQENGGKESFLHDNRVKDSQELRMILEELGYTIISEVLERNNGQRWTDSISLVCVRTNFDPLEEEKVNSLFSQAVSDWNNHSDLSGVSHEWIRPMTPHLE
jgi:hypothetical protein